MATLSGLYGDGNGERRKKSVVTYGRTSRNATFSPASVGSFFEAPKRANTTSTSSKLKRPTAASTKPIKEAADEFDIPLSEDESQPSSRKTTKASSKAASSSRLAQRVPDTHPEKHSDPSPLGKRKRTVSQVAHRIQEPEAVTVKATKTLSAPRRSRRNAAGQTSSVRSSPVSPQDDHMEHERPLEPSSFHSASPSPQYHSSRSGSTSLSVTPKQSRLWHELLLSDPPNADTASPPPQDPTRGLPAQTRVRGTELSWPGVRNVSTERKARIVDRLKRNVSFTQDISSSDSSSEHDSDGHENASEIPAQIASADLEKTAAYQVAKASQSQDQSQVTQTSFSQGTLGNKVTYARSRTYLEDSLEDALLLSDLSSIIAPERPSASMRRTAAPLKAGKPSKPIPDDDSDEGASQGIRSIHELRAAGHKKRFTDEIGRLVDDIKNPKPTLRSQRRSALMELAMNLANQEWASRFVEYGFDTDFAAQFGFASVDCIANTLLCVALARLLQAKATGNLTNSLFRAGALEFLTSCLDETKDVEQIARDRRNNMSKVAQSDYVDFMSSTRVSDFEADCLPARLTPQVLAMKSLESLLLTHRRHGHRGAVLSPDMATALVNLATDSQAITNNATCKTVHLALSSLEAASTLDALDTGSNVWSADLLTRIASSLPLVLDMPKTSQGLVLRLSVNVTNGHAGNCDIFSGPTTIHLIMSRIVEGFSHLLRPGGDNDMASDLDILLLALGFMMNLVECSETARENAYTDDQGLTALVDVFVRGREKTSEAESEEEMQSNIPHGYLAVLLGNMCQNSKVRELVRVRLPGQSLQILIEAIDEFVNVHKQVDSQTTNSAEGNEVWAHWTERLSAVVSRLREYG